MVAVEAAAVAVAELLAMVAALGPARLPLVRRRPVRRRLVRPVATRQPLVRLPVVAAQVAVPEMRLPLSRAIRRLRPRSSTSVSSLCNRGPMT